MPGLSQRQAQLEEKAWTVKETHEKLKVGDKERLNCYYAHAEDSDGLQRRCYWILEQPKDDVVLVHYLRSTTSRAGPRGGGAVPVAGPSGLGSGAAAAAAAAAAGGARPQRAAARRARYHRYGDYSLDSDEEGVDIDTTTGGGTSSGALLTEDSEGQSIPIEPLDFNFSIDLLPPGTMPVPGQTFPIDPSVLKRLDSKQDSMADIPYMRKIAEGLTITPLLPSLADQDAAARNQGYVPLGQYMALGAGPSNANSAAAAAAAAAAGGAAGAGAGPSGGPQPPRTGGGSGSPAVDTRGVGPGNDATTAAAAAAAVSRPDELLLPFSMKPARSPTKATVDRLGSGGAAMFFPDMSLGIAETSQDGGGLTFAAGTTVDTSAMFYLFRHPSGNQGMGSGGQPSSPTSKLGQVQGGGNSRVVMSGVPVGLGGINGAMTGGISGGISEAANQLDILNVDSSMDLGARLDSDRIGGSAGDLPREDSSCGGNASLDKMEQSVDLIGRGDQEPPEGVARDMAAAAAAAGLEEEPPVAESRRPSLHHQESSVADKVAAAVQPPKVETLRRLVAPGFRRRGSNPSLADVARRASGASDDDATAAAAAHRRKNPTAAPSPLSAEERLVAAGAAAAAVTAERREERLHQLRAARQGTLPSTIPSAADDADNDELIETAPNPLFRLTSHVVRLPMSDIQALVDEANAEAAAAAAAKAAAVTEEATTLLKEMSIDKVGLGEALRSGAFDNIAGFGGGAAVVAAATEDAGLLMRNMSIDDRNNNTQQEEERDGGGGGGGGEGNVPLESPQDGGYGTTETPRIGLGPGKGGVSCFKPAERELAEAAAAAVETAAARGSGSGATAGASPPQVSPLGFGSDQEAYTPSNTTDNVSEAPTSRDPSLSSLLEVSPSTAAAAVAAANAAAAMGVAGGQGQPSGAEDGGKQTPDDLLRAAFAVHHSRTVAKGAGR